MPFVDRRLKIFRERSLKFDFDDIDKYFPGFFMGINLRRYSNTGGEVGKTGVRSQQLGGR
jgi:hypothetical protein